MFLILSTILLIVSFMAFASRRLLTYLHIFQQEEYDEIRFVKWLLHTRAFDKRLSLVLLGLAIIWLFVPVDGIIAPLLLLTFAGFIALEADPRKQSKKKLEMTARAKRIYYVALGVALVTSLLFSFFTKNPFLWIITVQFLPLTLVLAKLLLQKNEEATQQQFWDEAHAKLKRFQPTIIGITGSYGKTSVKHILAHILGTQARTLATPGSVNTPMGIARIVREELREDHKYFICEMGAYGPGSIARLCRLAPPEYGIITAIGHAHYERFKSLETVAETKFELAQAILENVGSIIVEEKTLKFPYSSNMVRGNPGRFVICGDEDKRDLVLLNVYQKRDGIEVKIRWKSKAYTLEAPLYGSHHGENVALSFACACTLGLDPKDVISALKTVPQIRHRLEVKETVGPIRALIIDDAYNSNPRGFRAALDLLDSLGTMDDGKKSRRILITPGMVELGHAHEEQHRQLGQYASTRADLVLVIGAERIPSFVEGFEGSNPLLAEDETRMISMKSFAEAQEWVNQNMRQRDVILIENDLPDLYERIPKF